MWQLVEVHSICSALETENARLLTVVRLYILVYSSMVLEVRRVNSGSTSIIPATSQTCLLSIPSPHQLARLGTQRLYPLPPALCGVDSGRCDGVLLSRQWWTFDASNYKYRTHDCYSSTGRLIGASCWRKRETEWSWGSRAFCTTGHNIKNVPWGYRWSTIWSFGSQTKI